MRKGTPSIKEDTKLCHSRQPKVEPSGDQREQSIANYCQAAVAETPSIFAVNATGDVSINPSSYSWNALAMLSHQPAQGAPFAASKSTLLEAIWSLFMRAPEQTSAVSLTDNPMYRSGPFKLKSSSRVHTFAFVALLPLLGLPQARCQGTAWTNLLNPTDSAGVGLSPRQLLTVEPLNFFSNQTNVSFAPGSNQTNASFAPGLNISSPPSGSPTVSFIPTMQPTVSPLPSSPPSIPPTIGPTISAQPSSLPSSTPSHFPSPSPSIAPSAAPTFVQNVTSSANFVQTFMLNSSSASRYFNATEEILFRELMVNYTQQFEKVSLDRVQVTCTITGQYVHTNIISTVTVASPPSRRFLRSANQSKAVGFDVHYRMAYSSRYVNVSTYPTDFEYFINDNLTRVTADLDNLGIPVLETQEVAKYLVTTSPPSTSLMPSAMPTMTPSVSMAPSSSPSTGTSMVPSGPNTVGSMPSSVPSRMPSFPPSLAPTSSSGNGRHITAIVVPIVVGATAILLIALYCFYRNQERDTEQQYQESAGGSQKKAPGRMDHGAYEGSWNAAVGKNEGPPQKTALHARDPRTHYSPDGRMPTGEGGLISPSESLVSNQSLLSTGNSMAGDSDDEADTTQNLQDEFDQYKDQNLEKMRAEVEDNLTGIDGMMSQALTTPLMDDDDLTVDPSELLWGGSGQQSGAEIEASALCEVTDWLKRYGSSSMEKKRAFMQEMLNKMVSSVRHGVLGPDDASRAIHECASLLNLQLASNLPVTTVIITGMRKNVTAEDIVEAFREFGEIDDAAVASNRRGFGLVRYKNTKSVDRAMRKFLIEEIVVQDVAVQVKVLSPTKDAVMFRQSGGGAVP